MFEPMPVGLSIVLTGSLGWLYNKMLIRVRLVQPQPTTGAKDLEQFKFSRLDGMCKSADRKLDGQGLLLFFFFASTNSAGKTRHDDMGTWDAFLRKAWPWCMYQRIPL